MTRPAAPAPPLLITRLPGLVPPGEREYVAGFCSRCDQPARLRIGPGADALCIPCRVAETHDVEVGIFRRKGLR